MCSRAVSSGCARESQSNEQGKLNETKRAINGNETVNDMHHDLPSSAKECSLNVSINIK